MTKQTNSDEGFQVIDVRRESVLIPILGETPLIFNRLSEKAKRELLLPGGRKTDSQRAATLKHDPVAEFRASPHMAADDRSPTRLLMPSVAFKGAMRTATADQPSSATKAGVGRLVYAPDEMVSIYGIPELRMDVVRQAGRNRTPDVRTRAMVPHWAAMLRLTYSSPFITMESITRLLAAAGITVGVGDYRPEKGAGNFGQFRLVDAKDEAFVSLMTHGGRDAQDEAMANPIAANEDTRELLEWFDMTTDSRGLVVPSAETLAEAAE